VLMLVVVASAVSLTETEHEWLFAKWMNQHNKVYKGKEALKRFLIWKENMELILAHNAEGHSYKMAMNKFGDMTRAEWKARLGTHPRPKNSQPLRNQHAFRGRKAGAPTPPAAWDWRQHNAVNPVQNQGQCGSCWAFTTGDSISGLWAIKTGLLFAVSVQEIVDCSGPEGNQGCNGGLITNAMQWVIDNGGICDWQEYAYVGVQGQCMSANCTNVATVKAFVNVPTLDEAALMDATYQTVVSTAVEADQAVFQFYTSGIIDSPTCGTELDHGMTVIGWGTDAGVDYWILRNMWGEDWGEQGYVRLVRGKDMCGLAMEPTYATEGF